MIDARCLLFTPANKPERFNKAKETGADGLIIDLEDAIALKDKDSARGIVVNYLKNLKKDKQSTFIYALRINSIKTRAGLKDLCALIEAEVRPDVLILPKSEGGEEIEIINAILSPDKVPIIPLIETAKGLKNVYQIAQSSNVTGIIFGGADMAADLGAYMNWEPMLVPRSIIVQAAASAGITAIDVPYLHLNDPDDSGIIEETKRIKEMGYTCKLSIHPKHIKPINHTLSPTLEEINKAQRIVVAYEYAHGNAIEVDGKMIDVPVYKSAKRILSLAKLEN